MMDDGSFTREESIGYLHSVVVVFFFLLRSQATLVIDVTR